MKLNDKNCAIHLLFDKSIRYRYYERSPGFERALSFMQKDFPLMRDAFRRNIQYISRPFFEAFQDGVDPLIDILKNESVKRCGTFLISNEEDIMTIMYDVNLYPGEEGIMGEYRFIIFVNLSDGEDSLISTYLHVKDSEVMASMAIDKAVSFISDEANAKLVLGLILFINHCEVETKTIRPGLKSSLAEQQYENSTRYPIEFLDASWYTTIVRSESYMVGVKNGGFWRKQPCGPGRTQRKLIWILPHEKKGYVREAKVLKKREE